MIPTAFDYVRATSVADALAALAADDGAKVIAGGHSLLPMMKFRLAQPGRLVDIGRLAELRGLTDHQGGLRIGATTTYREVLASPLAQQRCPLLIETCHDIGDVQVRNRGTVGGSVAHADPASDLPAVMLALDASFVLRAPAGERTVRAREFFRGAFDTALAHGELLTHLLVPALPAGTGSGYATYRQAASGYAVAAAAAVVTVRDGTVTRCDVATTGIGDVTRLVASAGALVGTAGGADLVRAAAAAALEGIDVQGDVHAPAEYRRHLGTVVVRQAIERALARAT